MNSGGGGRRGDELVPGSRGELSLRQAGAGSHGLRMKGSSNQSFCLNGA